MSHQKDKTMMPEYEPWEREQLRQAEEKARKEGYDAGWKAAQAQPAAAGAVYRSGEEFGFTSTALDQPAAAGAVGDGVYRVLWNLSASIDQYWNGNRSDAQIKKICSYQAEARKIIDRDNEALRTAAPPRRRRPARSGIW